MKAAHLERKPAARARRADVREDERRQLARDLHDGPAQSMAAALFGVDLAIASLDRAPIAARDELLRARELLRDALDDLRALMAGLRPKILEERGLVAALQSIAAATPLWGPEITVETRGMPKGNRLPIDVELAMFRVAQEAVSNARRHGAAAHVTVSLEHRSGWAKLTIDDDGAGFPRQIRPAIGQGLGLPGMRERAERLGGELAIESKPGLGTRIALSIPLPEIGTGTGEDEL
jgi:two-component system NarL family sensor kinase